MFCERAVLLCFDRLLPPTSTALVTCSPSSSSQPVIGTDCNSAKTGLASSASLDLRCTISIVSPGNHRYLNIQSPAPCATAPRPVLCLGIHAGMMHQDHAAIELMDQRPAGVQHRLASSAEFSSPQRCLCRVSTTIISGTLGSARMASTVFW
jgi:hypothetical protein